VCAGAAGQADQFSRKRSVTPPTPNSSRPKHADPASPP
jgi:hypothetical protein